LQSRLSSTARVAGHTRGLVRRQPDLQNWNLRVRSVSDAAGANRTNDPTNTRGGSHGGAGCTLEADAAHRAFGTRRGGPPVTSASDEIEDLDAERADALGQKGMPIDELAGTLRARRTGTFRFSRPLGCSTRSGARPLEGTTPPGRHRAGRPRGAACPSGRQGRRSNSACMAVASPPAPRRTGFPSGVTSGTLLP
jgi:hypothetical protein